MMDNSTQIELMQPSQQSEWNKGYKAFHDCLRFSDMTTEAERDGWEAARRNLLRSGEQIAKRGRNG